jgi:hypothetical protein
MVLGTMTRALTRPPRKDDSSGKTTAVVKGVLLGFGALVALGLALSLLKYVILVGVLGAAGYFGYRAIRGRAALGEGKSSATRQLADGSDFDRKMRELEAIERRLDREISDR